MASKCPVVRKRSMSTYVDRVATLETPYFRMPCEDNEMERDEPGHGSPKPGAVDATITSGPVSTEAVLPPAGTEATGAGDQRRPEQLAAGEEQAPGVRQVQAVVADHFAAAMASLDSLRTAVEASATNALNTFDLIAPIIAADNEDIRALLDDSRSELLDAYLSACAGRTRMSMAILRGVMEGLFTALYYRQQSISLNLWASGTSFLMVHSLLQDKHEFYMYFNALFKDEAFTRQYPTVGVKDVFKEASEIYDELSGHVHKKHPGGRSRSTGEFDSYVERVFRISLCFVEREEDLPKIAFPVPATFAAFREQNRPALRKAGTKESK